MEVIPVLDVRQGVAVQGKGGDRHRYRPVVSVLAGAAEPLSLARSFRERLGVRSCYLADLAAIGGGPPDIPLIGAIADAGLALWVDAGITDAATADRILAAGASRAVIGLETLPHLDALYRLSAALPPERLAFSLDLQGRWPMATAPELATATPLELADQAVDAGYRTLIVLDLARVGTLGGPASESVALLRARHPELSLVVGGGVRNADDLRRIAELGCRGALVGTALHAGRIGRMEIETVASR